MTWTEEMIDSFAAALGAKSPLHFLLVSQNTLMCPLRRQCTSYMVFSGAKTCALLLYYQNTNPNVNFQEPKHAKLFC